MKKLLLLAGILVVASSVFGAATTEVSGDVDIYAQVVNNLSFIKGDPLNFGVVARGSTNSVVAGNGVGSFTIEGAQGVPVMISMSADGNTYKTVVEASSIEAKISDIDLLKYDLIGFGSAIHFAEHDILLQRFVSKLSLQEKNVFIFSTRSLYFL